MAARFPIPSPLAPAPRRALARLALAAVAFTCASGLARAETATAIFAGGCFWSMERIFDSVPGVTATTSGYTGGSKRNPSYDDVSTGTTGHLEAVKVAYDTTKTSYAKLLDVYWHSIDPTTPDRAFCDAGAEYQSAIFAVDGTQLAAAQASKQDIERTKPFKAPVVTKVLMAGEFWPAEEYHQDFYLKNPARYQAYRVGCRRDARLEEIWGKLAYTH